MNTKNIAFAQNVQPLTQRLFGLVMHSSAKNWVGEGIRDEAKERLRSRPQNIKPCCRFMFCYRRNEMLLANKPTIVRQAAAAAGPEEEKIKKFATAIVEFSKVRNKQVTQH